MRNLNQDLKLSFNDLNYQINYESSSDNTGVINSSRLTESLHQMETLPNLTENEASLSLRDNQNVEMNTPTSPLQRLKKTAKIPINYLKSKFQPGGVKSSIFLIISTVLGVPSLTIPLAFKLVGLGYGLLLNFISMIMTYYTLRYLIECTILSKVNTFEGIGYFAFGK